MTKNLQASVRARLLNIARAGGAPFQEILVRYGIERMLYRLQHSRHADDFILKGATLFACWTDQLHRPTKDVDFLTHGAPEIERLEGVFRDVLQTEVEPDGLDFVVKTLSGREIREDNIYRGVRLTFEARLGTARIPLQVDVGFGDAIVPAPAPARLPALLEFPAPELAGYTRYTVVAEKYDAMLALGELNSRMKDFYDIWTLCRAFTFDGQQLQSSIQATCQRRETVVPLDAPIALRVDFAELPGKRAQWKGFLRRIRHDSSLDFEVILRELALFLLPPTKALAEESPFSARWPAGGPWE